MHTMILQINSFMHKLLILLTVIITLGFSSITIAQQFPPSNNDKEDKEFFTTTEWAQKPVPCNDLDKVFSKARALGLKPAFGGMGTAPIPGRDGKITGMPVTVYLFTNLKTGQWIIVETNQLTEKKEQKGCIISEGRNPIFDPEILGMVTAPKP